MLKIHKNFNKDRF